MESSIIDEEVLILAQIIKANLLHQRTGILAHQCNNRGVMGAGIAKQIRERYPSVYTQYRSIMQSHGLILGQCQVIQVSPSLYVANLIAQDGYGRDRRYTDYEALRTCIEKAYGVALQKGLTLYLPFNIGCGLAGGDWKVVSGIIDEVAPNAVICRL